MAEGGEVSRSEPRGGRARAKGAPPEVDPNEETAPHGVSLDGKVDLEDVKRPAAAAEHLKSKSSAKAPSDDEFPPGRCELCGWRNVPSAVLCEGCGSDLQTGEPPPVERFRPRRFDARWVVAGCVVLALAGASYAGRALYLAGADERAVARAEAHQRDGRLGDAEGAYRDALSLNDKNARAWAGLAEVLGAAGQTDEARRAARQALALDPQSGEAHAALGRLLLAEGTDLEQAQQHLRSAISLKPDLPDLLHLLAHALYASDQRREARTRYREALARDPRSKEAPLSQLRLGTLLIQLNLLGEAEEQLAKAEQGGAAKGDVRAALADLEARRGSPDKAVSLYEEAIALGSKDPWVRFRLARLLHQQLARPDEALAHLEDALLLLPDQPAFLKLEGAVLDASGQTEAAYRSYKRAESLDRNDAEVLQLLAAVDRREGRLPEARDHLERALAIEPKSVEGLVALAQVATLQKDNQAALRALEAAAQVDPRNAEVHYLRGNALLRGNDRKGAIAAWVAAAEADKKYAAPRLLLVDHYREDGRFDDAARMLEDLVGLRQDDVDLQIELARLWINHCTVRRYDAAIEMLERVLDGDPDRLEAQRLIRQAQALKLREGG